MEAAKSRWSELIAYSTPGTKSGKVVISDPWVEPLIKSKWGQSSIANNTKACYNYYTPTSTSEWLEGKAPTILVAV